MTEELNMDIEGTNTRTTQRVYSNGKGRLKISGAVQQQLKKMSEVTRLLTSSLETTTVVRTIIEAIPQLIPNVEACVLLMYDPTIDRLVARDSVGFIPETLKKFKLKPGESMSGYSFLQNKAAMYSGEQIGRVGLVTLTPSNRALQQSLTLVQAKSVMCAPLDFKGRALGVITVNNFQSPLAFTEFDLELLQSLASQASISIENSRLYEEQRESLVKMEQLNQIITRQHQQLETALHIHRTLSGLALQNLGLGAITRALANILNKPVAVTDLLFNNITGALPVSGANESGEEEEQTKAEIVSLSRRASNQNDVPEFLENDREIYPIQAGNDKLGYILTTIGEDLANPDFAKVAIEQAATIIALEMVKEQSIFEVERRLRGELLEELLNGTFDDSFASRASLLGYDSNCLYWIILADIDDFRGYIQKNELDENQIAVLKRRLLKFITGQVTRNYPKSIITARSDMLIILLGIPRISGQVQSYERALKSCQEINIQLRAEFYELNFSLALSRPTSELEQFKTRYDEVVTALQMVGTISNSTQMIDCNKLGAALLLLKLSDRAELLELVNNVLGKLIYYDHQHHSNLLETLAIYSKNNSDYLATAQQLHVHQNTMIYRLKRVEEIIERKLNNTNDWLDIQIALRLIQAYPSLIENIR